MEETSTKTENAVVNAPEEEYETEDISLRDYMAAQALGGVLDLMEDEAEDSDDFTEFAFLAARRAYAIADAMMVVRDYDFESDEELALGEGEEEEEEEGEVEEEGGEEEEQAQEES